MRRRALMAASMQSDGGSSLTFPIILVEGVNDSEYVSKFFDWARNLPLTGYEIDRGAHIFRNYALNNNNPDLGYPNDGFPLLYEDFRNVIRININEGEFYIGAISNVLIYKDSMDFLLSYIFDINDSISLRDKVTYVRLYLNGTLTISRMPTTPVLPPGVIPPPPSL